MSQTVTMISSNIRVGFQYGEIHKFTEIMMRAFDNDPEITYYRSKSSDPKGAMKVLMEGQIYRTYYEGNMYTIHDDNTTKSMCQTLLLENFHVGTHQVLKYGFAWMTWYCPYSHLKGYLANRDKVRESFENIQKKFGWGKILFIWNLCVDPDFQGKGYGPTLIRMALSDHPGIPSILDTSKPRNVEIYKKLGYKLFEVLEFQNYTTYTLYHENLLEKKESQNESIVKYN